MANNLDPDQVGHFVGPDQGPNCVRAYQVMSKYQAKS